MSEAAIIQQALKLHEAERREQNKGFLSDVEISILLEKKEWKTSTIRYFIQ